MSDLVVERVRRALHAQEAARQRNARRTVTGPEAARCLRRLRELVESQHHDDGRPTPPEAA